MPTGEAVNATKPVTNRGMKNKVFIIEDHPLMRRSLVETIEREADLTVCGQAEDAKEALAAIVSLRPDLVLTDIQLKSSSGLDLIKNLRAQSPGLPIIATTMFVAAHVEHGRGDDRQCRRLRTKGLDLVQST